jgi:PAS domain S-box-containing protein
MCPKKMKSSADEIKIYQNLNKKIIDMGNSTDEELLLDSSPYAMLLADVKNFSILTANKAFASIFKKSKKELTGALLEKMLELDAGERRRQAAHRAITEKKAVLLEDQEGGEWWTTLFQPILNKKGDVEKIAAFIRNITEEKSLEVQITEKNEEFWRRLIQYSNNSFFIVDEKGIIRYVTESVNTVIGYEPEEIIGKKIFEFFYDADKKKAVDFFEKVLKNKSICSMSHRIVNKDGKIRFLDTTANNLIDNPVVKGIIITSRDITNTHKAQIEMQETKKYIENIINSASEIIFSVDTNGTVTLWNERTAQITGYPSKSIIGKKILSISIIQESKGFKSYMDRCCRIPSKPFDVKILTKHGESRLLRIQGSPVKKESELIKGVVFTGRDITSDAQIHGHLVTGASYLILEEDNSKAIDLLNGLLLNDFKGLFITREISQRLFDNLLVALPVTQYFFSQHVSLLDNESAIISDPSALITVISNFFTGNEKSIVLIDRLDYFIALHGFTTVMQMVYTLSSIASKNEGIILIRLNPEVISSTELAILNEELKSLPEQSVENITIDNKLFDILQFVERQNTNKALVSFKNVSKKFSITKVTTAKRINSLEEKDLVTIKKRGRLKTIYVTDKGKRLLQRRNVV